MIKILCSNIRFDNPADAENAWPNRKNLLANKIRSLSPSIFGTQEGREPQLRELEDLVDHNISDINREWIEERMYPCLFSLETPIESGDIWLSDTPNVPGSKSFDSMFPRLATWGLFKNYMLCNVHLDHDKESTRLQQAKVLINEILKIKRENTPLILMGDFNTHPESEVYETLIRDLDLEDPWKKLGVKEESSFHLFQGSNPDGYRIDWILHTREFSAKTIKLIKDHQGDVYLSDHFPVYCELELK